MSFQCGPSRNQKSNLEMLKLFPTRSLVWADGFVDSIILTLNFFVSKPLPMSNCIFEKKILFNPSNI